MRSEYTVGAIQDLIDRCCAIESFELVQIHVGTLGYGEFWLISPDEHHYNFHIQERYVNCWSSTHTIRRCRRIGKANLAKIEIARMEMVAA